MVRVRFLLGAAVLSAVCFYGARAEAAPVSASRSPAYVKVAIKQLKSLSVLPAGSMRGYSRVKFGEAWADVDDNNCDTRDDIMQRDFEEFTLKKGSKCVVQAGVLDDPYTGETIRFSRGVHSADVQIDHVVALAAAWRTGASKWTPTQRLAYANDPFILLAVDGPANEQKSDLDASEWLPPRHAFGCRFVALQISIKARYSLWLTQAEHDTMAQRLKRC
jgi:Protein of unknown function (DUF1524)